MRRTAVAAAVLGGLILSGAAAGWWWQFAGEKHKAEKERETGGKQDLSVVGIVGGCWGDQGVNWFSEREKRWNFKVVSDGQLVTEPVLLSGSGNFRVVMRAGFGGLYCVREKGQVEIRRVMIPTLVELPDGRLYRFRGGTYMDDSPEWNATEVAEAVEGGAVLGGKKGEVALVSISPDIRETRKALGREEQPELFEYVADLRSGYFEADKENLEKFLKTGEGVETVLPTRLLTLQSGIGWREEDL